MLNTLAILLLAASVQAGDADGTLVGIEYFAGWWEPLPNKWHTAQGKDWRPDYPERVPLLGEYNTQETMDREIAAAAEHGVDFFIILWYYNGPDGEREPHSRFLNRGVTQFMESPNARRMRFMLEFCNHPPFEVRSDAEWKECVEYWTDCMKHPSYLRIDGKPVFKVHGGHYFLQQNEGMEGSRKRLDALRAAAREKELGELVIGCGVGANEAVPAGHWAAGLFDFTATYMDVPPVQRKEEDLPYAELIGFAEAGREKHTQDAVPYMPFVPAGWNPRPWPDPRPCFRFPAADEWKTALQRVKSQLAEHSALGLPGQKAFTIYAWNEFGEGGIVAPTRGRGYLMLDAIAALFRGD